MRRALLALVLPLLFAGCASEDGAFGFQRGGDDARDPYVKEHREVVSGSHAKRFEAPVDASPNQVNVTVRLDTRTHGLPGADATPAQLDVRLVDPSGVALREARVDVRAPQASLVAEDLAPGMYGVEVRGVGAAQELDGKPYGAGYVVSIEILYG